MRQYFALFFIAFILWSCKEEPRITSLSGTVFGTTYAVRYDTSTNYESEIENLFYLINKSLSTYLQNSDISKLNRNETINMDDHFLKVFEASKVVYKTTEGVFDPTIGAVVNAWDFGPEGKIVNLDSLKIKSLMEGVGLYKVTRINNTIIKPVATYLDFNAIAKGYAVDVVAEFLETQGISNFLVEIGGEIRAKGMNTEKQSPWKIGIETPNFEGKQNVLKAISIQDQAMATSGTYRKFKTDTQGNRYAHIIDTKTGYPSKTNILSVSVIASDCMTADAYATAFQAMGLEKVKLFLQEHPELKAFLIFENENKEFETLAFNGFPEN